MITFRTRRKKLWLEVLLVRAVMLFSWSSPPPLGFVGATKTTASLVNLSLRVPLAFPSSSSSLLFRAASPPAAFRSANSASRVRHMTRDHVAKLARPSQQKKKDGL